MSNVQFMAELRIRAYMDQIDGYQFGDPKRADFKPILIVAFNKTGGVDRQETLNLMEYKAFTAEQKAALLNERV